jgi:uncharacterized membrane protein
VSAAHADEGHLTPVLDRNIRALIERRRAEERAERWQERLADRVTRFTGSMAFVGLHLVLFGGWILWNLPWLPTSKFDPQFVVLAMAASVEAIFLSTFILISQNRMQAMADRRADLDVHISLLTEHEVTHLVRLVRAMAERMGLEASRSPELPELERDVRPEKVLERIEGAEDEDAGSGVH